MRFGWCGDSGLSPHLRIRERSNLPLLSACDCRTVLHVRELLSSRGQTAALLGEDPSGPATLLDLNLDVCYTSFSVALILYLFSWGAQLLPLEEGSHGDQPHN